MPSVMSLLEAEERAARQRVEVLRERADRLGRTDHAGIVDYFLKSKPAGKKVQTIVKVLDGNSAIDTGVYAFTLTDPQRGKKRIVEARYTYEYEKTDGKWLITNHHSSAMPEG